MDTLNTHQSHDNGVHRHAFRDFLTPDANSALYVTGDKVALDALDFILRRGSCIDRLANLDRDVGIYAPLLTSINHTCAIHWPDLFAPVTLDDLGDIQRQPWFTALLTRYAKTCHLPDHTQLIDDHQLTGDHAAIILEALTIAQRIPKMHLGIVAVCADFPPSACYYPYSPAPGGVTAWLIVETHSDHSQLYGIGSSVVQQQELQDQESEDEEVDSGDAEKQPLPTKTRQTAARVLAQQIPLPANLTAADILQHHQGRLQYVNMLKVALAFSNQKISEQCQAQAKLKQPSAVVKRINTALTWIEGQFNITAGAFRAVFDQERKNNGINIRTKETAVDDGILAANADKINAAMAWVKAGGTRPASALSNS